ncbi:glycosyltransferase [Sphingomonas sp. PB1R3]|uniref:glycosyltransferase n=1 Tax=Sphingomonas flavida TaxID=3096154 RepID=UPI002FC79072
MKPELFILCNAIADDVRLERGITTDSPAATRKVAMMAEVLRGAGIHTLLLSLGRGRQDGSGRYLAPKTGRQRGVATVYGPLLHKPVLSELLSCWAPLPILWRKRHRARRSLLLLYNRMPAYIPAIWFARLLGYRVALDLEDGETVLKGWSVRAIKARLLVALTDWGCNAGALLACRALSTATRLIPQQPYYGVVGAPGSAERFDGPEIHLLLGGTVAASTGADILAAAIETLREDPTPAIRRLHLHITGTGESLARFALMADRKELRPAVTVHGRLDDLGYRTVLAGMDVGLALKPNTGPLAHTTFPSKVVEMANEGLLVLTTDISDVRSVLGTGAIYLDYDDPTLLAERLRAIADDPARAATIAREGMAIVAERCGATRAGIELRRFLFPETV